MAHSGQVLSAHRCSPSSASVSVNLNVVVLEGPRFDFSMKSDFFLFILPQVSLCVLGLLGTHRDPPALVSHAQPVSVFIGVCVRGLGVRVLPCGHELEILLLLPSEC